MAYSVLARYYDFENADFTEDLDFWLALAEEFGSPILELGCGTGRVLLNLARRGYTAAGVDNEPEMLARLQAKLQQASRQHTAAAPTFVCASVAHFELARQDFRLAIMPYNTFMHLLTLEDQVAALGNIRRHVRPGAGLALDMPNPGEAYAAQEQGLTLERTFQVVDEDGDRPVQQFSSVTIDRAAQLAHITWLYDAIDDTGVVRRAVVPLTLRYTFPGEMRLLLDKCGFVLSHLYGNYERAPFAEGAPRMIVLAQAV